MSTYDISIVIPTYQRCASVRRALQALAQQTVLSSEYEVLVVIDGSQDGTREMVAQFEAPYSLRGLWQPNQGRAAACNAGIRRATGRLLVLLDDDMEPVPEFLTAHRRVHRGNDRLGVMGAVPVVFDASSRPIMQYVGAKFNEHLTRLAQPDHTLCLRDFYSGNFSIRRELLRAVGLFDEAFTEYGNEDLELYVRLRDAGVRVVFSPEAIARQHYTKAFVGLARDNVEKGRTAVLLAEKHPDLYTESKLGTPAQVSWRWQLVRTGLLTLTDVVPALADWLIRGAARFGRLRIDQHHLCYRFILDYCFWLGVRSALRERGHTGVRPPVRALGEQ